MGTSYNDLDTKQKDKVDHFVEVFESLSEEFQLILLHLMQHPDELLPLVDQLDKESDTFQDDLQRIVLSHKAGIEIRLEGIAS